MMMFFPEQLKTKVKSQLRDLRFVARELRATTQDRGEARSGPSASGLAVAVADFSDNALSAIESVAIGLLSSDPKAHFGTAVAHPLDRYFGGDASAARANFARDHYFAAKGILAAKGVSNPRLSEDVFGRAHDMAVEALRAMPAPGARADRDDALAEIGRKAAAVACAIVHARPVLAPRRIDDPAGGQSLDANLYIAAASALASAVATYHDDLTPKDEVYASVCAAIDARYAAIEAAAGSGDPAGELALVFGDLAPHLP